MKCPHCHIEFDPNKLMKAFQLRWKGGDTQDIKGIDIADAMRRAGIGGGALKALDTWKEIED